MTTLTFYGGVDEIGGNKILLQDHDTRVLLDFGMSFKQSGLYFSEFLQPRKCNGIGDFLATGLLPDIPGIYREDYLRHMGRPPEEQGVDAVLISHAHMDHVAYVNHLRRDIELHMTPGTHALLTAIQRTSQSSFDDYLVYSPSFELRPRKRGEGYTKAEGESVARAVHVATPGEEYRVGDIEVTPLEVDHSVPGATSWLIHTTEGTVLYTGDLRFHGYFGEKTNDMVRKAAEEGIDLLITEGTRVDQSVGTTEEDVHTNASQIIGETRGLAVVNFPPRDLARFLTFYRIAEATNRKLVIGFKQAALLEEYHKVDQTFPSIDDPRILLYAERKEWGTAGREGLPSNIQGMCIPGEVCMQDYKIWEREYLQKDNCVCFSDLTNHSEYMFYCNYFQLNELIDVKPTNGSVYIRSITEPFDEEMTIDARRIDNWLDLFSLTQYGRRSEDGLHASGHAAGPEIRDMVQEIDPRIIVPIHTEHPEAFNSMSQNVVIVEKNGSLAL
jgi:ribonuclease J